MTGLRQLWRDRRGASAIEFAFAAPVLLIFIFGMMQLGQIYEANNGLNFGMDEANRTAILYPRPTDAAIRARVIERKFGLDASRLTITFTRPSATSTYVDISGSYSVPINFVMFKGPAITFTTTRRAYQAPTT